MLTYDQVWKQFFTIQTTRSSCNLNHVILHWKALKCCSYFQSISKNHYFSYIVNLWIILINNRMPVLILADWESFLAVFSSPRQVYICHGSQFWERSSGEARLVGDSVIMRKMYLRNLHLVVSVKVRDDFRPQTERSCWRDEFLSLSKSLMSNIF